MTGLSTAAWPSYSDPGFVEIGYVHIDAPATLRALRRRPARALLEVLTRTVQICGTVYADHCVVDEDGDWSEITRDRFDDAVRQAARVAADWLFRAADPCP